MDLPRIAHTFVCVLVLGLAATGLWAAAAEEEPAAATEKEMVRDPATGEMVSAPEYGGTLTYATGGAAPANADTHFLHVQAMVTGATTEKLGIMDWAIDRDEFSFRNTYIPLSVYRPHLAESWDTPDPLTIIFNIRKGVNWQNKAPMNGREFTADDVVFNFHRLLGLGEFAEAGPSPFTYQRPLGESVTATDRYTVVIKLPEPSAVALGQYLGIGLTYMNAPEVIREHGDVKDWRNLVGTGPYLLTDWTDGSSFTFQKNSDYWKDDEKYPGNRLPYIDEIQGLIVLEEATYLAGLRTGKIDFLGFPVGVSDITSVEVLESLQKNNPEIVLQAWWDRSENSYAIDASKPPFDDVRVRRAMQMAIDLEGIDRSVYQGTSAWQPQGIIGEGVGGYFTPFDEWPEEVKSGYRYDPAAAEALLDEAGYPRGADGTRFTTVLNHLYRFPLGYSELAATYWAEIGVDVKINVLDEAGAGPARSNRTWEGLIYHTMGNNTEPLGFVRQMVHSSSHEDLHGVRYPELDALLDDAAATDSEQERQRLVKEVDLYTMENHWWIWGPKAGKYMSHQPWVVGFNGETWLGFMDRLTILARLWIDSELKAEMGY
ncbi:MAG: ABC transporter substrate-binding protein [Spirochaetaceae bacterium]|nr:ABC transporter substrate-binding protein [Spirochaetaceae bacterium]